jgi:iron-sulfur cluster repair protein YtfE (RIC family)
VTTRDPLAKLSHDHGHLSGLVLAVGGGLARIERAELSFEDGIDALDDVVESLREELLAHFAREEEGFFPFVESHLPDLRPRVETLRADHDAVCERVAELCRAVRQGIHDGVGLRPCRSAFERFEELYARHAQLELTFLNDVDATIDGDDREQLRILLAAI